MKRENKITFRVSDYEKKMIHAKLKKSKISLSDFCRYATLGKEIRHFKGLDKCSYELGKIGNNINQITVLCHLRAVQNPSLDEICKQLCKVVERIYAVLGGDGDSQAVRFRVGNLTCGRGMRGDRRAWYVKNLAGIAIKTYTLNT